MLLTLGGAAWLFWPKAGVEEPLPRRDQPAESVNPPPAPPPTAPPSSGQEQIAQKSVPAVNRYRALAQASYRTPDFAVEIRGEAPVSQDALNAARRALAERRYTDALRALQNVTADYQPDAAYLRGHALFGLKEYLQAAAVFEQLTGSIRYGEAAQWYEVLALLPDYDHTRRAVLKKLKKIAEDKGHPFQPEAAQLYQRL